MKKYNITAKKNLGQNFLVDNHVINKILKAAEITKEDLIIEVGPGLGVLTAHLSKNAGKCIAIEIDKTLASVLSETMSEHDNLEIVNGDALKIDFDMLISENEYSDVKLVANLPYYITTPIIMKLLEDRLPLKSITVMVQKEVAGRIRAEPGTKDYGALTLAVRYYADTSLVANVPSNCFVPRPTVDSAVIKLEIRKLPPVEIRSEAFLFALIRAAFSQRRKTLTNCIYNYEKFNISKELAASTLKTLGFSESVRGESLSLEQFAQISNALYQLDV